MKLIKIFIFFAVSLLTVCCSNEHDIEDSDFSNTKTQLCEISPELSSYLNSKEFLSFIGNKELSFSNIDVANIKTSENNEKQIKEFTIPFKKGKNIMGTFHLLSKFDGAEYKMVCEIVKMQDNMSVGESMIFLGDGTLVSSCNLHKDGEHFKVSNIEVYIEPGDATRANRKESWTDCVARVYHTAKKACSGDAECDMTCDMVNLAFGSCYGAMAVAAAWVCA